MTDDTGTTGKPTGSFSFLCPVTVLIENGVITRVVVVDDSEEAARLHGATHLEGAPLADLVAAVKSGGQWWPAWQRPVTDLILRVQTMLADEQAEDDHAARRRKRIGRWIPWERGF